MIPLPPALCSGRIGLLLALLWCHAMHFVRILVSQRDLLLWLVDPYAQVWQRHTLKVPGTSPPDMGGPRGMPQEGAAVAGLPVPSKPSNI
jgi:hypothetical protein